MKRTVVWEVDQDEGSAGRIRGELRELIEGDSVRGGGLD